MKHLIYFISCLLIVTIMLSSCGTTFATIESKTPNEKYIDVGPDTYYNGAFSGVVYDYYWLTESIPRVVKEEAVPWYIEAFVLVPTAYIPTALDMPASAVADILRLIIAPTSYNWPYPWRKPWDPDPKKTEPAINERKK